MAQGEDSLLLFKTIFRQTPISTQIFTPDGETLMVNKAWEELWNVKFKELQSYNILKDKQLIKTGTMPYIKRGFKGEQVALPVISYDPQLTVPIKGTRARWLSARMYPIKNKDGAITHLVLQHEDVTERKKNEDAFFRLAAIVESSQDAIVSKTPEGIITSWNKGAERLFGYKASEMVGKSIMKIIPKELQSEEKKILLNIRRGRRVRLYETIRLAKDKRRISVSLSSSPIKDDKGNVIGASKIARDVTLQKKAEEKMRESEELFRTLTSHAPVGIFLTDKDGNCMFVNEQWLKFAGMTKEEALGSGWVEALHPQDKERVFKAWYAFTKRGNGFDMEYRFLTPKGKITWLSGTAVAIRDQKKNVTGYMGTIADITERKRALASLEESEERLRLALDAGSIGVWDWDVLGGNLTWTNNVYKIHGVKKGTFTVTFENFSKLIHPEDKGRVLQGINKSLAGGYDYKIEFRIVPPSGDVRWVSTQAVVIHNEKGQPARMLGATSDITQQKQLEQEKSDFLSMASHELKTPLTSMKMFVDLMQKELKRQKLKRPFYYATRIKDQTDRLTELTNDLLDVSRIETGKLKLHQESFDLNELVNDTIEGISASTNHKFELKSKARVQVFADRYRIYQVLINLLTNAVKYSPSTKKISVSIKRKGKEAIVGVKDYGIGITKEKQSKIFERLYQVTDSQSKTYPGLGLGLYISKEIIERHKGKIMLKSKKGEGSFFYFNLKVSEKN